MAYDALRKKTTTRDFSLPPDRSLRLVSGELPLGATGYAPDKWWTKQQAEDKVAEFMRSGGLFGTKLGRADAEAKTLVFLRRNNVGLMAGSATLGSWILNEKDQKRILEKVDDVRYDLRLVSRRVGITGGLLAGALGLLGVASIYKTSSDDRTRKFGQLQGNRYGR